MASSWADKQAAIALLRDPEAIQRLASTSGRSVHDVVTELNLTLTGGTPDVRYYHQLSPAERKAMPDDVASAMINAELKADQERKAAEGAAFFTNVFNGALADKTKSAGTVTTGVSPSADASNKAAADGLTGGN
jgi:hypothetical protein